MDTVIRADIREGNYTLSSINLVEIQPHNDSFTRFIPYTQNCGKFRGVDFVPSPHIMAYVNLPCCITQKKQGRAVPIGQEA